MILKIKDGFILKTVAGMNIIIPLGEHRMTHQKLMILNDTGAYIWNHLVGGCTEESLSAALSKDYAITMKEAKEDIRLYIKHLSDLDVIEVI